MTEVSRTFKQNNRKNILNRQQVRAAKNAGTGYQPWERTRNGEMPPMMFQLRFRDGRTVGFAFSDLREVSLPNAGTVELLVHSMRKLVITLEGRHLKDLANLFCNATVKHVQQSDPRDLNHPTSEPEVTGIQVAPYLEPSVPNLGHSGG